MAKKKKKHLIGKFIFILIILGALIYLYGSKVEIKNYKVKEYKVASEKITDNFDGFTIVHLTDIHYGRVLEIEDLKKVVSMVNDVKPDIVVLTGDLIDRNTKMTTDLASKISKELNNIKAGSGKYAISGNHDVKFDEWDNIISGGGFSNLNNTYDTIYNKGYESMVIAGLSSFKDKKSIGEKIASTDKYLNSFEKDGPIYNILIMHEPDYIDELENNRFDLILAGHSHGGKIRLPFIGGLVKVDGATKYIDNHYKIKNSDLYVSNGIGVSLFNFRFMNAPSFNVYRLVKSA